MYQEMNSLHKTDFSVTLKRVMLPRKVLEAVFWDCQEVLTISNIPSHNE